MMLAPGQRSESSRPSRTMPHCCAGAAAEMWLCGESSASRLASSMFARSISTRAASSAAASSSASSASSVWDSAAAGAAAVPGGHCLLR